MIWQMLCWAVPYSLLWLLRTHVEALVCPFPSSALPTLSSTNSSGILELPILPDLDTDGLRCRVERLAYAIHTLDVPPAQAANLPDPHALYEISHLLRDMSSLDLHLARNVSLYTAQVDELVRRQTLTQDIISGRTKSLVERYYRGAAQQDTGDIHGGRPSNILRAEVVTRWLIRSTNWIPSVDCHEAGRRYLGTLHKKAEILYDNISYVAEPLANEAASLLQRLDEKVEKEICALVDDGSPGANTENRSGWPREWRYIMATTNDWAGETIIGSSRINNPERSNHRDRHQQKKHHYAASRRTSSSNLVIAEDKRVTEYKDARLTTGNLCNDLLLPLCRCKHEYVEALRGQGKTVATGHKVGTCHDGTKQCKAFVWCMEHNDGPALRTLDGTWMRLSKVILSIKRR